MTSNNSHPTSEPSFLWLQMGTRTRPHWPREDETRSLPVGVDTLFHHLFALDGMSFRDPGREEVPASEKEQHLKLKHSACLIFENQTFPPGSGGDPPAGSWLSAPFSPHSGVPALFLCLDRSQIPEHYQPLSRCPEKGQAPRQREGAWREARSQRGRVCMWQCVCARVCA